MIEAAVGLHVESLTPPSAPGHLILSALIDSVLGSCIPTAVRDLTKVVRQGVIQPGPKCRDRTLTEDKVLAVDLTGTLAITMTIPETGVSIGCPLIAVINISPLLGRQRVQLARPLLLLSRIVHLISIF